MKIILAIFLIIALDSCTQDSPCSELREGTFKYADNNMSHILINRSGNNQVEIDTKSGMEVHSIVKWTSDCNYILTYSRFVNTPSDTDFSHMIGKTINAEVIKVDEQGYYCHFKSEFSDEEVQFKFVE